MRAGRLAAALAAMAIGGGRAMADDGPAGPTCRIDAEPTGAGVALSGRATAPASWSGRYSLAVRKIGPAGQSNITQGGALTLEPSRDARFGQVAISLEPGARYEAVLTMVAEGRSVECRATGPGSPL